MLLVNPIKNKKDIIFKNNFFYDGDLKKRYINYIYKNKQNKNWNYELTNFHEQHASNSHPIDLASRATAIKILKSKFDKYSKFSILELGSSSGFFAIELKKNFPNATVIASDIILENIINISEKYEIPTICFDIEDTFFGEKIFDVILSLNVLEHINNDTKAISNMNKMLKDDGYLYAEVPYGSYLYDQHDKFLLHYRRYSNKLLESLLTKNSLEYSYTNYIGQFAYPFFVFFKMLNKIKIVNSNYSYSVKLTKKNVFFDYLLFLDKKLSNIIQLPFGIRKVFLLTKIWPKTFPPLTKKQLKISDDFMKYWHEILPKKYSFIDRFNHLFVTKASKKNFKRTLELGAGLGEHLSYEKLSEFQIKNYYVNDIRKNMLDVLIKKFPTVNASVADCTKRLNFKDNFFDRIIAIHLLEHLHDLPSALKEIYRVIDKKGQFEIVLPTEGSFLYTIARRISAQRFFEKKYKQKYSWWISREHVSSYKQVLCEVEKYFIVTRRQYFPFFIPLLSFNLVVGLILQPKTKKELESLSKN